ncbi:hypothetical protein KY285_035740 [Solanum tuberosum]|nr:hypothetical protein KY289_035953 [Solanum tuberosum]KAH0639154.1 hypothetical protein KY285_035740 [Solanum tuberosum]
MMLEKYQEILQNQTQTQSDVDQWQAYYQAGGKKKRRIYGLGAQAKVFSGPNLCVSSGSDVSGSAPCPNAKLILTKKVDGLVMRMIPSLTNHLLLIFVEHVRGLLSPTSSQPDSPTNHPSTIAPIIPAPATENINEDRASVSEE